jgi:hypothetical protein
MHTGIAWLPNPPLPFIPHLAPVPFAAPLLSSLSASYAKQMTDLYTLARPSLELISV